MTRKRKRGRKCLSTCPKGSSILLPFTMSCTPNDRSKVQNLSLLPIPLYFYSSRRFYLPSVFKRLSITLSVFQVSKKKNYCKQNQKRRRRNGCVNIVPVAVLNNHGKEVNKFELCHTSVIS